jgi:PKD repeat protein
MRSLRLLAATTVICTGVWACGDNGGVEPGNDPVANFTPPACVANTPCTFTDASTDNGTITAWNWTFGDPANGSATVRNPTYTYAAAGTYTVTLTVTDNEGNTDNHSAPVTVTAGTTNQPPVAGFTVPTTCVAGADCLFTDTSTDDAPPLAGWAWTFGDPAGGTANVQNPTYRYAAAGQYQVTLTVTDAQGLTNAITQTVTIGPGAATSCTTISDVEVDCLLNITQRSTITITLAAEDCELDGNLIHIPPPGADMAQNVFTNVCHAQPVGTQRTLSTEAGAPLIFEAGSQLHVRLRRGTGTPTPGAPAGNITGTSPTWTINFDDGGNPGGPGEPDFTDVVLTVQSNPA